MGIERITKKLVPALQDIDGAILVLNALDPQLATFALFSSAVSHLPSFVAINKCDLISDTEALLLASKILNRQVILASMKTGRGIDEVKVWMRFTENDRSSVARMERMDIRFPDGRSYPLGSIADVQIQRGVSSVNHINAQRVVKIEADIVSTKESVPELLEYISVQIMPGLLNKFPDVSYDFEGQSRESDKTTSLA